MLNLRIRNKKNSINIGINKKEINNIWLKLDNSKSLISKIFSNLPELLIILNVYITRSSNCIFIEV